MTKEETKKCIEVMQAYVDGKEIQFDHGGEWVDVKPDWTWGGIPKRYRIKSEPHLRPYKDMEEFMKALKEHGGWLLNEDCDYATKPVYVDKGGTDIIGGAGPNNDYGYERVTFGKLLEKFTWIDGTPCGIMEE